MINIMRSEFVFHAVTFQVFFQGRGGGVGGGRCRRQRTKEGADQACYLPRRRGAVREQVCEYNDSDRNNAG